MGFKKADGAFQGALALFFKYAFWLKGLGLVGSRVWIVVAGVRVLQSLEMLGFQVEVQG